MKKYWNWQQDDWPHFSYEVNRLLPMEEEFLHKSGILYGIFKHFNEQEKLSLKIDLLSHEAVKTSEIEGEILRRDSVQSSIRKHFGLQASTLDVTPQEEGIAEMMKDLYLNYKDPLSHNLLWKWHEMIMGSQKDIKDIAAYRTHEDPMQVVSGYIHKPKVHFEAPPSKNMQREMNFFVDWFNKTSRVGKHTLTPLIRAGIAHIYFVSIHPFEDGNGRLARALVEKALSQHLNHPTLISLSHIINKGKKDYYDALEHQNKHNHITEWLYYFGEIILKAQTHATTHVEFIIQKTLFFDQHKDVLNPRQRKVVERMLKEGMSGFRGGLSAENYQKISKVSASTATRDLQDLLKKGVMTRTGMLKSTRYYLTIAKNLKYGEH